MVHRPGLPAVGTIQPKEWTWRIPTTVAPEAPLDPAANRLQIPLRTCRATRVRRRELLVKGAGALGALTVSALVGPRRVRGSGRQAQRSGPEGRTLSSAPMPSASTLFPHMSSQAAGCRSRSSPSSTRCTTIRTAICPSRSSLSLPAARPRFPLTDSAHTVQLRKGIKFHDGTRFDAAAVEFRLHAVHRQEPSFLRSQRHVSACSAPDGRRQRQGGR